MNASATRGDGLLSMRTWLLVWFPIAVTTVLHYGTVTEEPGVHGVLRRVYYLPIIVASFRHGLRGGVTASVVTTLAYLPHAFSHVGHHDPAPFLEKALEIVLYNVVGFVSGYLATTETRRREELQRAFDQQRSLQDQLVRAGRLAALGEVVAGVAHEVRTPLHALKGSAEIIEPELRGEQARRMWRIHRGELDRLQNVADRFLSFARPAAPELGSVDLCALVGHVVEIVDTDARRRGVMLETRLPPTEVLVTGDFEQLVQVLLNLTLNAMRATGEPEARVEIVAQAGPPCVLSVENAGPEIPLEDLERVFDPFFTTHAEGAGLGLSISARIAAQHDGRLWAENVPGGVRFSLELASAGAPVPRNSRPS